MCVLGVWGGGKGGGAGKGVWRAEGGWKEEDMVLVIILDEEHLP